MLPQKGSVLRDKERARVAEFQSAAGLHFVCRTIQTPSYFCTFSESRRLSFYFVFVHAAANLSLDG